MPIKTISEELVLEISRSYPDLKHLNLSNNEIRAVEHLSPLTALERLNLSGAKASVRVSPRTRVLVLKHGRVLVLKHGKEMGAQLVAWEGWVRSVRLCACMCVLINACTHILHTTNAVVSVKNE